MRRPTEAEYPDILERAADILESEQVGWCQGKYFEGPFEWPPISACALGSIRLAVAGLDKTKFGLTEAAPDWLGEVEAEIDDILMDHLDRNFPLPEEFKEMPDWGGVATYNDTEGRTKAEVIDVFKQVAKDLRNAANQ